jgi:integrase
MRLPNGYGGVVKLSGNRRNPYAARITTGWQTDGKTGKKRQCYRILGYAPTKAEALKLLAKYNNFPLDSESLLLTFSDVYDRWSAEKYASTSQSTIKNYRAAYGICKEIQSVPFRSLRLEHLQRVVDRSDKNYPMLRRLKMLFHQLYAYAIRHEIVEKDYSEFVDVLKYKDKNPNKKDRDRFTDEEIERLWAHSRDPICQTVLMLIYNGVRVSELLNLKRVNVHLGEQYFDVVNSKTANGIRQVPIANRVLPFYDSWYNDNISSEYLLHTPAGLPFKYGYYYRELFRPYLNSLNIDRTPHCCRHTTISMLASAHVDQTTIKKIVGHAGAMSLTERVYTHLNINELIDAINKI